MEQLPTAGGHLLHRRLPANPIILQAQLEFARSKNSKPQIKSVN